MKYIELFGEVESRVVAESLALASMKVQLTKRFRVSATETETEREGDDVSSEKVNLITSRAINNGCVVSSYRVLREIIIMQQLIQYNQFASIS